MEPLVKTSYEISQTSNDVLRIINERRCRNPKLKNLVLDYDLCRLAKEAVVQQRNGKRINTKKLSQYYNYASNMCVFASRVERNNQNDDFPTIIVDHLKGRDKLYDSLLSDRVDCAGLWVEFPTENLCIYAVIGCHYYEFDRKSIDKVVSKVEGKCSQDNILNIINDLLLIVRHRQLRFNDDLKRYIYNQGNKIHEDKKQMKNVVEIFNEHFKSTGNFIIIPVKSNEAKEFIHTAVSIPAFLTFIESDIEEVAFDLQLDSDGQLYFFFASQYNKIEIPIDADYDIMQSILKPINTFRASQEVSSLAETGVNFISKAIDARHINNQADLEKLAKEYGNEYFALFVTAKTADEAQKKMVDDIFNKGLTYVKSASSYAINVKKNNSSCNLCLILYNNLDRPKKEDKHQKGGEEKPKKEKKPKQENDEKPKKEDKRQNKDKQNKRDNKEENDKEEKPNLRKNDKEEKPNKKKNDKEDKPAQKKNDKEDKPKKEKKEKPPKQKIDFENEIIKLLNARLVDCSCKSVERSQELDEFAQKLIDNKAKLGMSVVHENEILPLAEAKGIEDVKTIYWVTDDQPNKSLKVDEFVDKIFVKNPELLKSDLSKIGLARQKSFGNRTYIIAIMLKE